MSGQAPLTRLVELDGIEYEASDCTHCQDGTRFDPTLADNVHSTTRGRTLCGWCLGSRTLYRITARGIQQECERRAT